jgi:hypothetical protein
VPDHRPARLRDDHDRVHARPSCASSSSRSSCTCGASAIEGAFHEAVTNQIFDHLVATIAPRALTVTAKFWVRGGITTTVTVTLP